MMTLKLAYVFIINIILVLCGSIGHITSEYVSFASGIPWASISYVQHLALDCLVVAQSLGFFLSFIGTQRISC